MAGNKEDAAKLWAKRGPAELEPMNLNIPQASVDEVTIEEIDNIKAVGPSCSSSPISEEGSALECDFCLSSEHPNGHQMADPSPLQTENNAAFFLWPPAYRLQGSVIDRTNYFCGLQKVISSDVSKRAPSGPQATTLLDLMIIRAYHSKQLRRVSVGTAVGFRIKQGILTNIPAIIVFVSRKVQKAWLQEDQKLPVHLEGPGGIWCDVDVVEFAYFCTTGNATKEQVYTELVEGLRGNDPCIGPGSQVASQETYGTLGAIVQSRNGACQVGFLTNRHVAVDLDYPNQKMFHPLPPNCGPGIYLGAVERATSYITDERWYHIFASINPETFVRADGAFIPFGDGFDMSRVTTTVKGVGDMGDAKFIELLASIDSIVGRQVVKVGRSTGRTNGRIMAYALEYNDQRGICYFTDLLVVGENKQAFDLEGDSGSLILMVEEGGKLPRPVGMIWGGTANRGRLKMQSGHGLENWTSAVDLGRLLDRLQLDLITSKTALNGAIMKQQWLACNMGADTVGGGLPRTLSFAQPMEANPNPVFKTSKMKVRKRLHRGDSSDLKELGRIQGGWTLVNAPDFDREPIDFLTERSGSEASERSIGQEFMCKHMPTLKNVGNEDHSCGLNLYDTQRWL